VTDELLTIAMAADRCHVHYKTIERAIRERGLRASRLADRGCWVIRPADLEEWLDERANRPRTTPAQAPIQPRPHAARRHNTADDLHDLVPPTRRRAA
jgi:excisionase family DNA binding protein